MRTPKLPTIKPPIKKNIKLNSTIFIQIPLIKHFISKKFKITTKSLKDLIQSGQLRKASCRKTIPT